MRKTKGQMSLWSFAFLERRITWNTSKHLKIISENKEKQRKQSRTTQVIRNRIFGPKYKFSSFEEAETYLQRMLITLNESSFVEEEKHHLLAYKPKLELAENQVFKDQQLQLCTNRE